MDDDLHDYSVANIKNGSGRRAVSVPTRARAIGCPEERTVLTRSISAVELREAVAKHPSQRGW
jgi:hypothetical protein